MGTVDSADGLRDLRKSQDAGSNEVGDSKPAFEVIAQYVKDISFENVVPANKISADERPDIEAQIKVDAEELDADECHYLVSLILNIHAKVNNKSIFILDLDYKGEFRVAGFPKELTGPMLYIECPRQLFPFVRNIVATTTAEGGFPPMYLAPTDFVKLYQERLESSGQTLH